MRLLVDTHAYAWWVTDAPKLSRRALALMMAPETEVLVSAVVSWELANKLRLGWWPEAEAILADLDTALVEDRLTPLPLTLAHARHAGLLPSDHRDPFDRLLAAQSAIEQAAIVTADPVFRRMDVEVVW